MKKILCILTLAALLAPVVQAEASGVDVNFGINVGIPAVAAHVYAPAHHYPVQPVRVCQVETVRYVAPGHGSWQAPRDHYNVKHKEVYGNHRGWVSDNRSWQRGNH